MAAKHRGLTVSSSKGHDTTKLRHLRPPWKRIQSPPVVATVLAQLATNSEDERRADRGVEHAKERFVAAECCLAIPWRLTTSTARHSALSGRLPLPEST